MHAFIGACAVGCLPLASTLRYEQKGTRNLLLNVDFLGSMCRWFISNFIQYVLCVKMSQSVQVFGRKVSKKWTIFWLFYVDQTHTCIVNLIAVQRLAYVKPVAFYIELCPRQLWGNLKKIHSLFTSESPFLVVNYSDYWPKFSKLLIINWFVVPVWTLNMLHQLFLLIILTISRVWVRKYTCIKNKTAWYCVEVFFAV